MSCIGEVKSFNDTKGWGFITYEGADIFLHVNDCTDGRPQAGDAVTFDMEEDPKRNGQKKALNVTGCTGEKNGGKGGAWGGGKGAWGGGKGAWGGGGGAKKQTGTGACQGAVKSFNDEKGWGFITYEGTDVFVHVKDCSGGKPQTGDWVTFDCQEDPIRGAGQLKAVNVTGGSGDEWGGKGGGKGGYGPAWGASPWDAYSPYGGGGGGKSWPKGGWALEKGGKGKGW